MLKDVKINHRCCSEAQLSPYILRRSDAIRRLQLICPSRSTNGEFSVKFPELTLRAGEGRGGGGGKGAVSPTFLQVTQSTRSWALAVFFNISIMENEFFFIFYQVNLTGGRLLK